MGAHFAEWLRQRVCEDPGVDYDTIALAETASHAVCAERRCAGCWREDSCCPAPLTTADPPASQSAISVKGES